MNQIRLATSDDAAEILAIYAPYCGNDSAVSFEIEPPSIEAMKERLRKTLEQYPWLVYVFNDSVLGYAYATPFRARAAYRWSVETTVYVNDTAHRNGIGKALYSSLFAILRLQGFVNAYACITLPNPASIGMHKSFGFTDVGVYHQAGYKGSAWHDVGWLELQLQPRPIVPAEPRPLSAVINSPEFQQALNSGLRISALKKY